MHKCLIFNLQKIYEMKWIYYGYENFTPHTELRCEYKNAKKIGNIFKIFFQVGKYWFLFKYFLKIIINYSWFSKKYFENVPNFFLFFAFLCSYRIFFLHIFLQVENIFLWHLYNELSVLEKSSNICIVLLSKLTSVYVLK